MNRRFFFIMGAMLLASAVLVGLSWHYLAKFGSASGRVVERGSGAPVAGAAIELFAEFTSSKGKMKLSKTGRSREDGSFLVKPTVGGNFRITIQCDGYELFVREGIELPPESHVDIGTFELVKQP